MKILIAVDGSKGAKVSVDTCIRLFASCPPESVVLLHVQQYGGGSTLIVTPEGGFQGVGGHVCFMVLRKASGSASSVSKLPLATRRPPSIRRMESA